MILQKTVYSERKWVEKALYFLIISYTIILGIGCASHEEENTPSDDMISLSEIAERHSMVLDWNPDSHEAILSHGQSQIIVIPGLQYATVLNQEITLSQPAEQVGEEILIPQSFYLDHIVPLLTRKTETLESKGSLSKVKQEINKQENKSPEKDIGQQYLVKKEEIPQTPKPSSLKQYTALFPTGYKIAIDPGHGGRDVGASRDGIYEKNITLSISKRLTDKIKERGGEVFLTRINDRFISLEERVTFANMAKADCFISIHINAAASSQASGIEVWISKPVNQKIFSKSLSLAEHIRKSMINSISFKDRGIKQNNFYVLKKSSIPAVLIECGFISNNNDRKQLGDPVFINRLVESISEGILKYALGPGIKASHLAENNR